MKTDLIISILRRIFSSLATLLIILILLFFLIRLSPGSALYKYLSPDMSPELVSLLKHKFQLDESLSAQFFSFLKNSLAGDFGVSYSFHKPVMETVFEFLPFSIMLASISFFLQILIGGLLAAFVFFRRGSRIDKIMSSTMVGLYSIPSFVISLLLILLFSAALKIFPASGLHSFDVSGGAFSIFLDEVLHLILPVASLVIFGVPVFYKYFRDNFNSTAEMQFIEYHRTLGLSEREIFIKHIFPNSLNAVITIGGLAFGQLLGGALVIEVIFGLPGMGRLTLEAILARDFPLVIGCAFVSAALFLISIFAADILKILLDKRNAEELAG